MVSRCSMTRHCEWRLALRSNLLLVILSLFLFGCGGAAPRSPTPSVQTQGRPATPTISISATETAIPPIPGVSADQVRNAEYRLGATDSVHTVQLANGKYQQGAGADLVDVTATDFIALGDLTGDGVNEAAAVIAENFGGSGVFEFIAIYEEQNKKPVFLTSIYIDDRAQINGISIENGKVFLDAVVHSLNDAMCCPTLHTVSHYQLIDNQLVRTDYSTFTPMNQARTIHIESPANGAQVAGSVRVKGSAAIAPFENTLSYHIYDAGGVELSKGAVTVTAKDPGGPGTFDSLIDLGGILSGAVVRLEIQDLSAADGSLLSMDSVELVVK